MPNITIDNIDHDTLSGEAKAHLPTSLNVEEGRSDVGESEVSIVAMSAGNAAGSEGAPV